MERKSWAKSTFSETQTACLRRKFEKDNPVLDFDKDAELQ